MDKLFLKNIKEKRNLIDVMQSYNINYYITFRAHSKEDFDINYEPYCCFDSKAGSRYMTAKFPKNIKTIAKIETDTLSIYNLKILND